MKKLFWGFIIFCFSLGLPLLARASVIRTPAPAASSQTNQYYSVIYDKEMEAAVVAKLTYHNVKTEEIKDLTLEIPGTNVRIISAVQEKTNTASNCSQNEPTPKGQQQSSCAYPADPSNINSTKTYSLLDASNLQNNGQKATLKLNLAQPVASWQDATVILYYKATGLAQKIWNGYKYNFQTIKSPYDIEGVRVSINVAGDLYIKDTAEGQTNYEENDVAPKTDNLPALGFSESRSLSSVSENIKTQPGVVKFTSALDPNENFQVEGKYYNNNWMGELPTIGGVVITFIIILIVLMVVIRSEKNKKYKEE